MVMDVGEENLDPSGGRNKAARPPNCIPSSTHSTRDEKSSALTLGELNLLVSVSFSTISVTLLYSFLGFFFPPYPNS